jgi:DNA repair protein RecO (recombination protein O)
MRRLDFAEADRVLTLYTPALGKRRVVAKGVRKITSKLAGHLELFTHTTLMLAKGRNLDVVTQSQTLHAYSTLRAEPRRLFGAYYAIELLDRLSEEDDPNPPAFELLVATLNGLDRSRNPDLVLRYYELHLLGYAGYRPHLYHCAACQNVLTEEVERFSATLGGALCPTCAAGERATLSMSLACFKLLRFLQSQPFADIERLTLSEAVCSEAEALLRAYLRQTLERELKSVVFLDAVRNQLAVQGASHGLH